MQPRAFRRPAFPSQALDRQEAFDPDSFDFIDYLSRRLGVGRELTTEVVGHWLTHYEPVEASAASKQAPPIQAAPASAPNAAAPSGVFPAVRVPAPRATGTDA